MSRGTRGLEFLMMAFYRAMVSRIFASWNQTTAWLTQVEGLRRAA
jgi:hypothetical protein